MTASPRRGAGRWAVGAIVALVVVGGTGIFSSRMALAAASAVRPGTKVVLLTPADSDPLVARIEAELAAVGITVRRVATPSDSVLDSVVTREIAAGASAVIRVIPRSRGTEVWTGETTARVLRRRAIKADTSDAALSVIALRTVEFLRASLLDVRRNGPATASAATASGPTARGAKAGVDGLAPPVREPGAADRPSGDRSPPTAGERTTPGATSATPPAAGPPPASAPAPVSRPTRPPEASVPPPGSPQPSRPPPSPRPSEATAPPVEAPPPPESPRDDRPTTSTSEPSPPDVRPMIRPAPLATRLSARYELAAGPAVLGSSGGVGAITGVAAAGRTWIGRQTGLELMGVFPVVASHLTHPEGSIDVKVAFFGAGGAFRVGPHGGWAADGALGLCAQLFQSVGSGTGVVRGANNVGHSDSVWRLAGYGRIGGGFEITQWLRLRVDIIGGFAPSSTITLAYSVSNTNGDVATMDRATWGPAFGAGTVGLQAAW